MRIIVVGTGFSGAIMARKIVDEFGFDVDVLDYTELYKPKCKNGSTAYLLGLARALFGLKQRKAKIIFEDGIIENNVLLAAAGIGRFYGGGIEVTPNAFSARTRVPYTGL